MATDETNNENVDETAETAPEPEPEAAETPATEADETAATEAPAEDEAAAEPTDEEPAAETEAEAAPAKKTRSGRHVPRSQRRQRTKTKREQPPARKPIVRIPRPESERGRHQERRGVVVSDKGDKTIVVKVDVIKLHPKYKKVVRRSVKFHAHDEANSAGIGDTVRIVETRPLSKTKNWRLAEIVEKAR
jgi:small subunit ribosomal protein S17